MCQRGHDAIRKLAEKWHLTNLRTALQGKPGKPQLLVTEVDVNMRKYLTQKNSTEADELHRPEK